MEVDVMHILNDEDMIIDRLHSCLENSHCNTGMVHNVNCHMQYFPKKNPAKFRNYHKITLNCTSKTCTIYS